VSQELLDEYTSQKRNRTKAPWLITGLVKCPACKRLIKKSNWQSHKNYELNIRKGVRVTYKSSDGFYRCPVPGCSYPGTKNIVGWKTHLAKHPAEILEELGLPQQVSYLFIQIIQYRKSSRRRKMMKMFNKKMFKMKILEKISSQKRR
jgi:hypothetical protein